MALLAFSPCSLPSSPWNIFPVFSHLPCMLYHPKIKWVLHLDTNFFTAETVKATFPIDNGSLKSDIYENKQRQTGAGFMGPELGVCGNWSHALQPGPVLKGGDREETGADVKRDCVSAKHAYLCWLDCLCDQLPGGKDLLWLCGHYQVPAMEAADAALHHMYLFLYILYPRGSTDVL